MGNNWVKWIRRGKREYEHIGGSSRSDPEAEERPGKWAGSSKSHSPLLSLKKELTFLGTVGSLHPRLPLMCLQSGKQSVCCSQQTLKRGGDIY